MPYAIADLAWSSDRGSASALCLPISPQPHNYQMRWMGIEPTTSRLVGECSSPIELPAHSVSWGMTLPSHSPASLLLTFRASGTCEAKPY